MDHRAKQRQQAGESDGLKAAGPTSKSEIVDLNVGGTRFSTSKETLTWIPESFFSSLMSGRIPSMKDNTGAIFIDRDPVAFAPILNYLRTRKVELRNVDLKTLKLEAEFYGILPLVKCLSVCEELEKSSCGSILFYCQLHPPVFEQAGLSDNNIAVPTHLKAAGIDFSRQVLQLVGHGNYIAIAYCHCICLLGVRESLGWEVVFTTPPLQRVPQRIALNARPTSAALGGPVLAAVLGNEIKVWRCSPSSQVIASFDMKIPVDGLFFIGNQLVAITNTGKVAVWQSVQQHWQVQELLSPICSYDTAGSNLLLGCANGSIYYIDMEKFPVRMKDNDLLVTQLFEDPFKEPITALSIFFTPNVFPGYVVQNWMEVAYGTRAGSVRVIVRHPENIGQAPQIFQSYNVHTCPILRVVLGEKHLISGVWDLSTALELSQKNKSDITQGGPTQEQLVDLFQNFDVSASRVSSAVSSRAPSPSPSLMSIMFPGLTGLGGSGGGGGGGGGGAIGASASSSSLVHSRSHLFHPIRTSNSMQTISSSAGSSSNLSLNVPSIHQQMPVHQSDDTIPPPPPPPTSISPSVSASALDEPTTFVRSDDSRPGSTDMSNGASEKKEEEEEALAGSGASGSIGLAQERGDPEISGRASALSVSSHDPELLPTLEVSTAQPLTLDDMNEDYVQVLESSPGLSGARSNSCVASLSHHRSGSSSASFKSSSKSRSPFRLTKSNSPIGASGIGTPLDVSRPTSGGSDSATLTPTSSRPSSASPPVVQSPLHWSREYEASLFTSSDEHTM